MTSIEQASRAFNDAADQIDTLYKMDARARELVMLSDQMEEAELTEGERELIEAELEAVLKEMLLKIERSAGFIVDMEKRAEAAEDEERRLRRLKHRRKALAERVRQGLLIHMKETGEPIIDTPRFTLALRLNNPAVEITDAYAVPDEYWRAEKVPSESDPEARTCEQCGAALVVSKSKVTTHWRATGGKSTPKGIAGGEIPPGIDIVRNESLRIS